jgi:hypothetical protein
MDMELQTFSDSLYLKLCDNPMVIYNVWQLVSCTKSLGALDLHLQHMPSYTVAFSLCSVV